MIQKQKNEMAAQIIDAGRFNQETTNEQRKETLEQILADETRTRVAKNEARFCGRCPSPAFACEKKRTHC